MRAIRMVCVMCCLALLLPAFVMSQAQVASLETEKSKPIDFKTIERKIAKLPALVSAEPRYGLLLFGLNGEKRMWAVLDKSAAKVKGFDRLYLDLNANGDLTEKGECFAGKPDEAGRGNFAFKIGKLTDPGTEAVHTDFTVTWRPKWGRILEGTRFTMKWRGGKISMGPFGPYAETYQAFGLSPEKAPIFVPGFDRPFEFEHWMCDKLVRGKSTQFKVFVGNRGDRTGTFFCVDDKFLEKKDSPEATLIYRNKQGQQQRYHVKLTERC